MFDTNFAKNLALTRAHARKCMHVHVHTNILTHTLAHMHKYPNASMNVQDLIAL